MVQRDGTGGRPPDYVSFKTLTSLSGPPAPSMLKVGQGRSRRHNCVLADQVESDRGLAVVLEHDLVRKPVSTPGQARGRAFRDHALRTVISLTSTGPPAASFRVSDVSLRRRRQVAH